MEWTRAFMIVSRYVPAPLELTWQEFWDVYAERPAVESILAGKGATPLQMAADYARRREYGGALEELACRG